MKEFIKTNRLSDLENQLMIIKKKRKTGTERETSTALG